MTEIPLNIVQQKKGTLITYLAYHQIETDENKIWSRQPGISVITMLMNIGATYFGENVVSWRVYPRVMASIPPSSRTKTNARYLSKPENHLRTCYNMRRILYRTTYPT